MDQDEIQNAKLEARKAALEARRERLRDLADSILDITETMEKPKTWLEAGRATRTIGAMDRVMIRLYSEPDLRCVAAMERAARRLKLDPMLDMDEAPEEPRTPESLERRQKELEHKINRYIKNTDPQRYKAEFPDEYAAEMASRTTPLWTDEHFAGSAIFGPPKLDTAKPKTPNSDTPNSYTSGDATPAPEIAKTEPPKRSGPSIRSLAPDWPPWPPR